MAPVVPRSILVVEEFAHWDHGHYPVRCAQLATAYAELGYRVELLTSEGWSRDACNPQPHFTVARYRRAARWFRSAAHRAPWFAHQLLTLILVVETRAAARRMVPAPDAVIVLAWDTDPAVVALTAGTGTGKWLINQFRAPSGFPAWKLAFAKRLEDRRRAGGGCVRLTVADEVRRADWNRVVPYLDPTVIPIAGTRELEPIPDARARLGVPPTGKLALLFGEPLLKQLDVVLDAFDQLDNWTLVVGGRVADDIEPTARRHTFPGVVTDDTRDLLFSAADLVVLSFPPDYRNNSGTLMDAISVGVPVVCSDDAAVAAIVTRSRLGITFTNGDADALTDAVRRAPASIEPADLADAREEHSNRAVARRQLLVLGIVHAET